MQTSSHQAIDSPLCDPGGDAIHRSIKVIAPVLAVVFIVLVGVYWTDSAHWFLRYTGADAESGTWYGFWSGFGGSIPDFLILGSIITVYRHHNCHVRGCLRLGKPVEGTPYVACPTHHPAHEGSRRSVSEEVIRLAHVAHLDREAQAREHPPAVTTGPTAGT